MRGRDVYQQGRVLLLRLFLAPSPQPFLLLLRLLFLLSLFLRPCHRSIFALSLSIVFMQNHRPSHEPLPLRHYLLQRARTHRQV